MIQAVLAILALSAVLSCVLTAVVRALGRRMVLLDSPGAAGHAKELRRVPNIGGVAIFWSIAGLMLAGLAAAAWLPDVATRLLPGVGPHLEGIAAQRPMALGLLAALLLLHVTGLVDDRRALGPLVKFGVQFAAAGLVVAVFDVRLLTALDPVAGGPWLSIVLTVLWLVAITNAMNFMDNMDGLAGGVAATAGAMFLIAALSGGQWFVASCLALLVGSVVGFLVFNFPWRESHRATIFMGDGGSLVIGFLLAFLTVRTTYVQANAGGGADAAAGGGAWFGVLMPLCVLAVPLYDLASVTVIRLAQGKSPLVGDRQHFSHRLNAAGLSVRRTVLVICAFAAVTGIGGIMLMHASWWQAWLIGVQVLLVLGAIGLYEHGKGWPLSRDDGSGT